MEVGTIDVGDYRGRDYRGGNYRDTDIVEGFIGTTSESGRIC